MISTKKIESFMFGKTNFAVIFLSLLFFQQSAAARIVKFEIGSREPFGVFKSVEFVRISGQVVGELQVGESIPDLEKADATGSGSVRYTTDFTLIVPAKPIDGNGTLVFDVENRGRPITLGMYNSPRRLSANFDDVGIGFLQDRGFMVAVASWELGQGIKLPTFVDGAGKTRYVEGVGFAAVRDFVAFLKYEKVDGEGNANPLAGAVKRAIGVGYSQTARFLKTSLLHGFNTMNGKAIFEGMHIQAGHSGLLPIMRSGTGPSSSGGAFPTFSFPNYPGVHEPPFTYGSILRKAVDRGESLPRMIVTNMANDYYSLRASLARTGRVGAKDAPIPENVRIYDVAGGAHAIILSKGCKYTRGNLDWHPIMRAVLVRLNRWIGDGTPPPDNRLMPLEARPGDRLILGTPPSSPKAVVQVPKRDRDGNDLGGVRLPELEVPLGTFAGQNEPLEDVLCILSATYKPFLEDEDEREEANDSRLSIEERYESKNEYVNRIARSAWSLVKEGFMLEQDAFIVIHAAASSDVVY